MSRMDKMMAKTANIRSTADISDSEVAAIPHVPKSGQGAYARRQSLEERIAELEKFGGEVILVANIAPNPWQPRRVFNEDEIRKLAESITEVGLIQPIVVRRSVPNRDRFQDDQGGSQFVPNRDKSYQIVAGERRWRAHQLLGYAEIKAVISDVADADMALMALAENLDREDLTDYETSKAIARVRREFKSKTRLAEAIGISRQDLNKYEAFLNLPKTVIDDLENAPGLLGRNAAEQVVATIKIHGQKALDAVPDIWGRVKSGQLSQGKFADALKTVAIHGKHVRTERHIKPLFVGKEQEQAGSITKDASSLTIKIKSAALSGDQEERLRVFVEALLKG